MKENENPPNDRSLFMEMIDREYENLIRKYFNTTANRNLSKEDNEDIFHDTIIKCNDIISNKGIEDEDEMRAYLFRSLKTNGYRETKYARNKQRDDVTIDDSARIQDSDQEQKIDLNIIYDYIEDRYGEDTLDIVKRHLEGQSVREIEESTGKKGLTYVINKVLKNIRRRFK